MLHCQLQVCRANTQHRSDHTTEYFVQAHLSGLHTRGIETSGFMSREDRVHCAQPDGRMAGVVEAGLLSQEERHYFLQSRCRVDGPVPRFGRFVTFSVVSSPVSHSASKLHHSGAQSDRVETSFLLPVRMTQMDDPPLASETTPSESNFATSRVPGALLLTGAHFFLRRFIGASERSPEISNS